MDLVITQEGMYPTFTIDGIEYIACRDYHRIGGNGFSVPVATVHCEMTHPEDYLPPVPEKRRRGIALFRAVLPGVLLYGIILLILAPGLLRGKDPLWKAVPAGRHRGGDRGGLLLKLAVPFQRKI